MKASGNKDIPMIHNDEALEKSWAEAAFKYAEMFEMLIIK